MLNPEDLQVGKVTSGGALRSMGVKVIGKAMDANRLFLARVVSCGGCHSSFREVLIANVFQIVPKATF